VMNLKYLNYRRKKRLNYSEDKTAEDVYREFMYRVTKAETDVDLTMHVCLLMPILDDKLTN
jgi:hypothetical protein